MNSRVRVNTWDLVLRARSGLGSESNISLHPPPQSLVPLAFAFFSLAETRLGHQDNWNGHDEDVEEPRTSSLTLCHSHEDRRIALPGYLSRITCGCRLALAFALRP